MFERELADYGVDMLKFNFKSTVCNESENTPHKFSMNPFLYNCSIPFKLNSNSKEIDRLFSIRKTIYRFLK